MNNSAADAPALVGTILLADYDSTMRASCTHKFEDAGWGAIAVSDGREALEVALAVRPDVVSASIFLPTIGGVDLCRRLKRDRRTASVWVMLHSSTALLDLQRKQAYDAGCDVLLIQGGMPGALFHEAREFLRSTLLPG